MRRSETGIVDVPPVIKTQMHAVRQRLAADFGLSTEKKPKAIVRVADEVELLAALWSSRRMSMEHERLRVQLALLIQLAGITGSRPSALMSVTYQDFSLSLLRDPQGSLWPSLMVDVTFRNTKSFLGPKAPNTIPIPQIPSEPCLLLCPQITLLSLIFADGAFDGLTSPQGLFQLKVPPGLNELKLPMKDKWGPVPVFRRLAHSVQGVVVSADLSATDDWLRDKLRTLGDVVGFDMPVGPYCFRRGAGEAFDSSGHVSDAQRNLILQHASSAVFQHSYLSRYVTADTHAAFRGLEPQTALMRAASGMSRTIDPRRPIELSYDQQRRVMRHPEVKLLRRYRDGLKSRIRTEHGTITRSKGTAMYDIYHNARRAYDRVIEAVRKGMLAESKKLFRQRQPLANIARQLAGADNVSSPSGEPESPIHTKTTSNSLRRRAIAALLTAAPSNPAEEYERRSQADVAISILCRHRDPVMPKICRSRGGTDLDKGFDVDAGKEVKSPTFPVECLPTQCIFCLGNSELSRERRTKAFYSHGTSKKHVRSLHLQHQPDGVSIKCPHPACDTTLDHKMHLQSHAALVHKTLT